MEDVVMYTKVAAYLGAAFVVGIGVIGPTLAQGLIGAKACENIGKYPESAGNIRGAMLVALAMPETASVFALLVALLLIFFS